MSPNHQHNDDVVEKITSEEIELLNKKYDKSLNSRVFEGLTKKIVFFILVSFSVFQLMTSTLFVLDAMILRSLHLGIGLFLAFIFFPTCDSWKKNKLNPFDLFLGLLALGCSFYLVFNYRAIVLRAGLVNDADILVGVIMLLLVLECARRLVGWPIIILAIIFILYAFYGRMIPGRLAHRGIAYSVFVQHQYFSTEGMLGVPIGVSSTFIFLFLLFGSFLVKTGMGEFFLDLCNSLAGDKPGGPAKVSVLSSACLATVTGSSVANVMGTGPFTIPMMKRLGYRSQFAAAVEAVSSTGGQMMPPIMGSAAFIMAEFTNIPYLTIAACAIIPSVLFYVGVWFGVHFEARKYNLKGLPKEQLLRTWDVLKSRGHLLLPIVSVVVLLVQGFSPIYAALGAIVTTILCSFVKKETRMSFWDFLECLANGAKSALPVISACACAGIIIGVVTQSGLGLKAGSLVVNAAGGSLFLTLLLTMVAALVFGIGVPTTANYVITATVAAPALLALKVPVLAAHMFVFYFGILADVTPPVCLAAMAAAGIAKSEPMKTGLNATRLAVAAFIVPFVFVYNPELLLLNNPSVPFVAYAIATAIAGMILIAAALTGFFKIRMNIIERLLFFAAGLMLLVTDFLINAAGGTIAIATIAMHIYRKSRLSPKL